MWLSGWSDICLKLLHLVRLRSVPFPIAVNHEHCEYKGRMNSPPWFLPLTISGFPPPQEGLGFRKKIWWENMMPNYQCWGFLIDHIMLCEKSYNCHIRVDFWDKGLFFFWLFPYWVCLAAAIMCFAFPMYTQPLMAATSPLHRNAHLAWGNAAKLSCVQWEVGLWHCSLHRCLATKQFSLENAALCW